MSESSNALLVATRQLFHDHWDSWREIVDGLETSALNWKPGDETNSIAVLVAHSCDASRFLMATAAGIELDRDREAKFETVTTGAAELSGLINATAAEIDEYIDQIDNSSLIAEHARPGRTHTGAWWLLHAIDHNREHIGQAYLTRQLYEQR